jgi:hypothetical protein
MLFKKKEEVAKYINQASSVDFEELKQSFEDAEREFIIPVIGQAQYDALNDKYTISGTSGLNTKEKALLEKIQSPLARFGMMQWLPEGILKVTGDGVFIVTTDTMKTPFAHQVDRLEFRWLKAGYSGIDSLLEFMESNKDDYPAWTGSSAYSIFKECFINSAKEFSSIHGIGDSRRIFLKIKDTMKTVEDFFIVANVGKAYYDALKTAIAAGSVSEDDKKTIVYIQKAVAKLTIARALEEKIIEIGPQGIYLSVFNDTVNERTAPGSGRNNLNGIDARLDTTINRANVDGQAYLKQLRNFLNANATTEKYPVYFASSLYQKAGTANTLTNSIEKKIFKL